LEFEAVKVLKSLEGNLGFRGEKGKKREGEVWNSFEEEDEQEE
jgi:hypothetical protein